MRTPVVISALLCLGFGLGCGPNVKAKIPAQVGRVDAPYEPAADEDLQELRGLYESLPDNHPRRPKLQSLLAAEYSRRIRRALSEDARSGARTQLVALLSLFDPQKPGSREALAKEEATLRQVLKYFSKTAGDIEASLALLALAEIDPENRDAHWKEFEEILRFGDELAVALSGPGAKRARPIAILETALEAIPSRPVVDRLMQYYAERQKALHSSFKRDGADFELIRVHGPGALMTARQMVSALAVSGRVEEALDAIKDVQGVGEDVELRKRLHAALASSDATPWILLSAMFREREEDAATALALCEEAIRRHPEDALAYIAAGEAAREVDNALLAIRYFERALELDSTHYEASNSLASLYEYRVSLLAYSDRPKAALEQLQVFEEFYRKSEGKFPKPIEPDLASAYAVMARGQVSLGDIETAREYLQRSLQLRPNIASLEYLGTMSLRQGHYKKASEHFASALALETDDVASEFDKSRLTRLRAEAEAELGQKKEASKLYQEAIANWKELLTKYDIPPAAQAEAMVELGKSEFELGNTETATKLFFSAVKNSTEDNGVAADTVAFLLNHDSYPLALDIYLEALGNEAVGQYFKIYMSLWILAESKRIHGEPEHNAENFLRKLDGNLWAQELARYAVGLSDRSKLESMANTRGRRSELLYYSAVVGPESGNPEIVKQLLEEVLRGSMLLFFEYEMAKRRLESL